MPDDYFTITRAPATPGTVRLLFSGDLDMGARTDIHDALKAAVTEARVLEPAASGGAGEVPRIIIDLRGVRFIDSEAIAAILDGYVAAEDAGLDFRLAGALGIVRRVFDVIGLHHLFEP
ncbi:anti-sigma B factor antagonist [Actinoplanes lutulentus]|uniref:Anti-anti-sigma factor n=1 Tax=Actinoplanes lutulentus TaxID=1287878 RepID=A0A327ZJH5_9ACTN|nr:STAS domain-containing protein [Actinoplanes lutulentus]MBB2940807.1 anti-sigma B factor antagonist [Actinoplanes lutulentus]RAK43117.1 anti-anti-sigma factor [Actinoplanes lutulentus]